MRSVSAGTGDQRTRQGVEVWDTDCHSLIVFLALRKFLKKSESVKSNWNTVSTSAEYTCMGVAMLEYDNNTAT